MYLDRYYVKHHNVPGLSESGLNSFKHKVFMELQTQVTAAVLEQVNHEREGQSINQDLIKSIVRIYEAMGMGGLDVYQDYLEEPLLVKTAEYYRAKSSEWVASDDTPSYLLKAERALESERVRVRTYFMGATEARLLRRVEHEVLSVHEHVLLNKEGSGVKALLGNDKREDLARLYSLFSRVNKGLEPVGALVKEFVQEQGEQIIDQREAALSAGAKDSATDIPFVDKLLQLHQHYVDVVEQNFQKNPIFERALKEAFESFINRSVGKHSNAELFATYVDRMLRSGEKHSDHELTQLLERVVQLFLYLQDKDLFSEVYRNLLGKRLLNNRVSNDDAEKKMISLMKIKCGNNFTSKMEGMMNDLGTTKKHMKDFKEFLAKAARSGGEAKGDEGGAGKEAASGESGEGEDNEKAIGKTKDGAPVVITAEDADAEDPKQRWNTIL